MTELEIDRLDALFLTAFFSSQILAFIGATYFPQHRHIITFASIASVMIIVVVIICYRYTRRR